MMRGRAFRGRGSLLVVVALALVAGLAHPGTELFCIGRDGHAAVEAVGGGCCGGVAPLAADQPGGVSLTGAPSCGDCIDVALDSELAGSKRLELSPPHAAPLQVASAVAHVDRASGRLGVFDVAPRATVDLAALATVVLLT